MKILCPWHEEQTPSCEVYPDGYKCFGCGARGPLSELPEKYRTLEPEPVQPEDLEKAYQYIDSLPKKRVRGLLLPADEFSFFIPWPDKRYYKRRFFEPQNGPKYIGARGHRKPWFIANWTDSPAVVLVEGELNALSISQACPELSVVSPGGSGDFYSKGSKKYWQNVVYCSTILLVADKDEAGAKAIIEAKSAIDTAERQAKWLLMKEDANEILQKEGRESLRKQILSVLGTDLEERA